MDLSKGQKGGMIMNKVYLEYVTDIQYNPKDVKKMTFSDIQSATNFIFKKNHETLMGGDLFYIIRYREL